MEGHTTSECGAVTSVVDKISTGDYWRISAVAPGVLSNRQAKAWRVIAWSSAIP